jgi:hypothetical protein
LIEFLYLINDKFTKYDNSEIEDYNLYIVKTTTSSPHFNKIFNLCFGKFLKPLMNDTINILAYKKPSESYTIQLKQYVYDDLDDFDFRFKQTIYMIRILMKLQKKNLIKHMHMHSLKLIKTSFLLLVNIMNLLNIIMMRSKTIIYILLKLVKHAPISIKTLIFVLEQF